MSVVAGIDVGSTYTKAAILRVSGTIAGRAILKTGYRLENAAAQALDEALASAGLDRASIDYVVSTGYGRGQVAFRDLQVTDLTAQAAGARRFFAATRTVLDIGGQTMKSSRLAEDGRVRSFRLNDKCAAGTGAFLEKTARYLGFDTGEIGPLAATSKTPVPISGVCAVFAESEVINHVSTGCAPADIMFGAMISLVDRSVQLMRRVGMEPEFTLVGGILRFERLAELLRERLGGAANVPPGEDAQFCGAIGAAALGHRRLAQIARAASKPAAAAPVAAKEGIG